ncbi:hypothetical protein CCMA1212_004691, partial [Trichoderma ghanense]
DLRGFWEELSHSVLPRLVPTVSQGQPQEGTRRYGPLGRSGLIQRRRCPKKSRLSLDWHRAQPTKAAEAIVLQAQPRKPLPPPVAHSNACWHMVDDRNRQGHDGLAAHCAAPSLLPLVSVWARAPHCP